MSDGELREAIICPAEAAGLQVEPGLTELLLRDAGLAGTAEDQAARLRELACEFGQGYYFYKPLSREDAHAVLQSHKWPVAEPEPVG